jgi:coproporphyrinogen III oxidase-like Fe-S oxidoreductase
MKNNIQPKIKLFEKINQMHFSTDYSSIDYLYPPSFIWKKTRVGGEIQKGRIFKNIILGSRYCLYIHFPFCHYKCAFCRQFSVPVVERRHYQNYENFLLKEIELYAPYFKHSKLTGIYLGGGTPTLFNLEKILKAVYKNFNFCSPFYLNIESTPDSLNKKKIIAFRKMGLTRLLIGVQSFDSKVLETIGRPKNQFKIFEKAYNEARQVNIPFINIELICGLPEQSQQSFLKDLNHVISLKPNSIHIYKYLQTPLTIFGKKYGPLSQSLILSAVKMYNIGRKVLEDAGYIYKGDDFALNDDARNPNYNVDNIFYKHQGQLALGISSFGYHPLFGKDSLRTFNTLNLNKYAKMISQKLLPIEKFYNFDSQGEVLRRNIIMLYRYGGFSNNQLASNRMMHGFDCKGIHSFFKKEFEFLEKNKQVKIGPQFSSINFNLKDWLIYSKIFYSQKVLKKCEKFIRSNPQLLKK